MIEMFSPGSPISHKCTHFYVSRFRGFNNQQYSFVIECDKTFVDHRSLNLIPSI